MRMEIVKSDRQGRNISIDIVKGLGIFLMVAGHCRASCKNFIYLFHMAIFFIASGYCYKTENSDNFSTLCRFIKRKVMTLWFPYALWTAIYSCLHNFFIRINIYTDNPLLLEYVSGAYIDTTEYWTAADVFKNIAKSFLMHGRTQLGGAFWFMIALMELSIAYCIIDFGIKNILKKNDTFKIQMGISILFLFMGYGCYIYGYSLAGIDKVLSYYILFHGGYTLKRYDISCRERVMNKHIFILISSFTVLFVCNQLGSIALNQNRYENPLFFLIVSFAGWQFLIEIAYFIKKIKVFEKCMICIGQNTLAVVILHFLCFKIVSYVGVLLKDQPLCLVAAFPILYDEGCWWIAYLGVGLIVPVLLSLAYKKCKRIV